MLGDDGPRAMRSQIDAQTHYQQKAERLNKDNAMLFGIILGSVATLVTLVFWEAVRR